MPWTNAPQTRIDVMAVLGLPLTAPRWLEWVDRAMDRVSTYGGDPAIALIEDYITKYQTAETNLNTSADQQAIKILGIEDGIEYFEGGATKGFASEMNRYRNLLLDALFWEGEKAEIRRNSSSFTKATVKMRR